MKLLNVKQVSERLGLTEPAVRKLIERKKLPYRKWGRRVLIRSDELEQFMDNLPGKTAEEAIATLQKSRIV